MSLQVFYAKLGQSLFDVCLNTYGSLDYLYKLLQDNGIDSVNSTVRSQQPFVWETDLVVDQVVNRNTTLKNVFFATAGSQNGSTYFVVEGGANVPRSTPYTPPYIQPGAGSTYQRTLSTYYVVPADGSSVTLPELVGKSILAIERNIQPDVDYTFNTATGQITFTNPLMADERLYILYTEMITIPAASPCPPATFTYQQNSTLSYTLPNNTSVVILSTLINKTIVQVKRGIQPVVNYTFDPITGTLTFDDILLQGESLFILYSQTITT